MSSRALVPVQGTHIALPPFVRYRPLLVIALVLVPRFLAAQESTAFPRFSIRAGEYRAGFATDARVDPSSTNGPSATQVNLEGDLGLARTKNLVDLGIQWRPLERHELEATYSAASRQGSGRIAESIQFHNHLYPVDSLVTTDFKVTKWEAKYTYWAVRSPRAGFGFVLGAAGLSLDANLSASVLFPVLSITESARTSFPVALGGARFRYAFSDRVFGEVTAAALPRVKVDVYSGRATSADARIEMRVAGPLGIGAAWNYFKIDGTVTDPNFGGRLGLRASGIEGYVRLALLR